MTDQTLSTKAQNAYLEQVKTVKQAALYPSMVDKLIGIMSNSLHVSGVESKHTLGKQKTRMEAARSNGDYVAAKARFALGNDDGAYLRSNIMPLQTSSIKDENGCRLNHRMTVDMRAASYIGLLNACQESATEELSSKQKTIARAWKVASWMLSVPEVKAFVKAYINKESKNKCDSASAAVVVEQMASGKSVADMLDYNVVGSMKTIFYALFEVFATNVQSSVTEQLNVIPELVSGLREASQEAWKQDNTPVKKALCTATDQTNGTEDVQSLHAIVQYCKGSELHLLPKSSDMLSFAMARGLCSRRAVHHRQLKDDLHYYTPTVSCPTISDMETIVCESQHRDIGSLSHEYEPKMNDMVKDFCAFDNQEKYCSAAWAPVKSTEPLELDQSVHAIDLATASVMEHLVSYYKTEANKRTDSDKDNLSFLARAACVKMKQIGHVAKVFSLDGKSLRGLCPASKLVTVPVRTNQESDCGSVLYAIDAGLVRLNNPRPNVPTAAPKPLEDHEWWGGGDGGDGGGGEGGGGGGEGGGLGGGGEGGGGEGGGGEGGGDGGGEGGGGEGGGGLGGGGEGGGEGGGDDGGGGDGSGGGNGSGDGEDQPAEYDWEGMCMFIPQFTRKDDIKKIQSAGNDGKKIDIGHAYAFGTLPRSDEHIDALSPENLEGMMKTGVLLCKHIEKLIKDIEASKQARKAIESELSGNMCDNTGFAILAEERNDLARSRREEVWNDSMREAAISGDRLYAFVRQFSGTIHDQVDSVCVIDESMLVKYQKDAQENTKRLSMLASQKYMQLVSNVFRSVIGESGLTLGIDNKGLDGQFKVVSNTLRKQVSELASGNGSDGFFTNSTKLENLMAQGTGEITLSGLFERLRDVGVALQQAANNNTLEGITPSAPSFDFLSSPRNSLILRYKPEAHAAMRQAFDTFSREMHSPHRHTGMYPHRKISAYELIEGRDEELCMAFASFSAHVLAHQRMFSASHAAYLGQFASRANVAAMHFTLNKLIGVASRYIMHTERPRFLAEGGWEQYFRL